MNFIDNIKKIQESMKFDSFNEVNLNNYIDYDGIVVLPPPNITGKLHIGHALNAFVQDFRIRFEKFKGRNILWIPGTDHSGIATQVLVERSIMPATKYDLGREKFLEKVWDWKEKYQNSIYDQLKSLGLSLNWDAAKFTMDNDIQVEVSKAFCELYEAGLIYKAKKMIYWDTKLETAISDLEVKSEEINGEMYHIKYKLENGEYITVATTRPETLFGDQAIAVHPDDERYKHLVDSYVYIPITNRKIPIIYDKRCEIEMGSGAVKITPAHDFLDFEIGNDHNLNYQCILDENGKLCGNMVPEQYLGLDRFEVRKLLVSDLGDHLEKIEKRKHVVPFGDRSGTVLEPRLTDQWFVDTSDLAKKALDALEKIEILPEYHVNTYKHWMNNIQPWCISRQLWWGHRIPVWYCDDQIIVALNHEEAKKKAMDLGLNGELIQEEDVLDTWFSSALWPFVTVEKNNLDLKKFYPNEFLVTGSDILFFWVARMIMFGCFFKKEIPFKKVYLHGLVQDDFGKKMSKSKNNVVDPMEVVEKEGVDVLRFALLYSSVPGKNVKFGNQNIDHARHFCIKIWNLYKYVKPYVTDEIVEIKHVWNIWIQNELNNSIRKINDYIENWEIHHAAQDVYKLVWDVFCNLYLEGIKYLLNSEYKKETQYTLNLSLKKLLVALNPFLPFITSYIYKDLFGGEIFNEKKINNTENKFDNETEIKFEEIEFVESSINAVRFMKANFDIDNQNDILYFTEYDMLSNKVYNVKSNEFDIELEKCNLDDMSDLSCIKKYENVYKIIGKIIKSNIRFGNKSEKREGDYYISYPVKGGFLDIPIKNFDHDLIKDKLNKINCKIDKDYKSALAKKNNDKFILNAPKEIVEEINVRIDNLEIEKQKIEYIIGMWENKL